MSSNRNKTAVLIIDDEQRICELLRDRFLDCNEEADCPYTFEVDVGLSAADCVQKVRAKRYDVIVLDIRMEKEASGLTACFALYQQLGRETPIRIILTGFPSYRQCVEAMRYGTWDYIVKEDVGGTPMSQIVVNSALARLQQLDLRREQEQQIAVDWLPQHFRELQAQYSGQLVALWHRPGARVIANGVDAFELEVNLKGWRGKHATWEQPMIVQIPPQRDDDERKG